MKGFFFSLIVIILISFVMISIFIWASSNRVREQTYPSVHRGLVMKELSDSSSPQKLERLSNFVGRRAVYYLDNYTRTYNSYSKNVSGDICMIMWNGSLANGTQTFIENNNTLSYWRDQMSGIASALGFSFNASINCSAFNATQYGPWSASIAFNMTIGITDSDGKLKLSRAVPINTSFYIIGYEDPLISVEDAELRGAQTGTVRQVLNYSYETPYVRLLLNASADPTARGKGWIYGNIINVSDSFASIFATNDTDSLFDANGNLKDTYTRFFGFISTVAPGNYSAIQTWTNATTGSSCTYSVFRETNCFDCLEWTSGCTVGGGGGKQNAYVRVYNHSISQAFIASTVAEILVPKNLSDEFNDNSIDPNLWTLNMPANSLPRGFIGEALGALTAISTCPDPAPICCQFSGAGARPQVRSRPIGYTFTIDTRINIQSISVPNLAFVGFWVGNLSDPIYGYRVGYSIISGKLIVGYCNPTGSCAYLYTMPYALDTYVNVSVKRNYNRFYFYVNDKLVATHTNTDNLGEVYFVTSDKWNVTTFNFYYQIYYDYARIMDNRPPVLMDTQSWNNTNSINTPLQNLLSTPAEPAITASGYRIVYDIENLRDACICGHYNFSYSGPDFLQRLAGNTTGPSTRGAGIETFVLGTWTNRTDKNYSYRDFKYYQNRTGYPIKGMPGCRDVSACRNLGSPLGHFALNDTEIPMYGAGDIYCGKPNRAEC